MGNSASKDTNTNTTTTTVSTSNSKSKSKNTRKKKKISREELKQAAAKAKASIADDGSLPNLLSQFAKLLQDPRLDDFEQLVTSMKDSWKTIMKTLKKYPEDIHKEHVATMGQIYNDYWRLLLNTRLSIGTLVAKCETQQCDVETATDILNEYLARKSVRKLDEQAYNECIQSIGDWIQFPELGIVFNAWGDMKDRLEAEVNYWDEQSQKELTSRTKRKLTGFVREHPIVASLCGVIFAGACAALIVATCGVGSVVLGTGLFAVGTVFAGTGIAVVAGTAFCVAQELYKEHRARAEAMQTVNTVHDHLKNMITTVHKFEFRLNKMKAAQKDVGVIFHKVGMDKANQVTDASLRMRAQLKLINKHLTKYIEQGNSVIDLVEVACQEIIG